MYLYAKISKVFIHQDNFFSLEIVNPNNTTVDSLINGHSN